MPTDLASLGPLTPPRSGRGRAGRAQRERSPGSRAGYATHGQREPGRAVRHSRGQPQNARARPSRTCALHRPVAHVWPCPATSSGSDGGGWWVLLRRSLHPLDDCRCARLGRRKRYRIPTLPGEPCMRAGRLSCHAGRPYRTPAPPRAGAAADRQDPLTSLRLSSILDAWTTRRSGPVPAAAPRA